MARMPNPELPPREMIAMAVLLADIISGNTQMAVLMPDGKRNLVSCAFSIADEFVKQAGETQ